MWQRLGKNKSGYAGETIDIDRVQRDILLSGEKHGWSVETFLETGQFRIQALRKTHPAPSFRLYISSGIHGDEPAGPLAVLELIQSNDWPSGIDLTLCPCLNPTGFVLNRRENSGGFDLNRQYHAPECDEVRAHVQWLDRHPEMDLAICLHEDWESHGFYLYELNPDRRPSHAEAIIAAVSKVCPIDLSAEIEGRPASGGVIRPNADPRSRPQWPESLYLLTRKTRHSYTLEAPSDFPLSVRVAALVTAVRTVLQSPHPGGVPVPSQVP